MKRFVCLLFALLLFSCGFALAETRYVSGGSLRIRAAADGGSAVLGTLYAGAPVNVTSVSGEWSCVQLADVTGWMLSASLAAKPSGDSTRTGKSVSPYGTPTVVLRSRPANSYGTVSVLHVGETVRILGEMSGGFLCVTAQGTGFLSAQEVR